MHIGTRLTFILTTLAGIIGIYFILSNKITLTPIELTKNKWSTFHGGPVCSAIKRIHQYKREPCPLDDLVDQKSYNCLLPVWEYLQKASENLWHIFTLLIKKFILQS